MTKNFGIAINSVPLVKVGRFLERHKLQKPTPFETHSGSPSSWAVAGLLLEDVTMAGSQAVLEGPGGS